MKHKKLLSFVSALYDIVMLIHKWIAIFASQFLTNCNNKESVYNRNLLGRIQDFRKEGEDMPTGRSTRRIIRKTRRGSGVPLPENKSRLEMVKSEAYLGY